MTRIDSVTLLLPVYNGGDDLHKMLRSLEALNVETNVLIYNDGSTDGSYAAACAYAENSKHRVRVVDGRKNRGYFRTIKIMLRICPTTYFMFLGHDDQLSADYLDAFAEIAAREPDIACVFTDIASITPDGVVTDTWPRAPGDKAGLDKIPFDDAVKSFHEHEWGNLFVAIWSKKFLNHRLLMRIMSVIPDSDLIKPLKRSGFLNDVMAILRIFSHRAPAFIFHNRTGVYYKAVDFARVSEGSAQFKRDKILQNPIGYNAAVAHLLLPQIKQKGVAAGWALRYFYIHFGVAAKSLFRNPRGFDVKVFSQAMALIVQGYLNSVARSSGQDRRA